jgi:hypothetical protein
MLDDDAEQQIDQRRRDNLEEESTYSRRGIDSHKRLAR